MKALQLRPRCMWGFRAIVMLSGVVTFCLSSSAQPNREPMYEKNYAQTLPSAAKPVNEKSEKAIPARGVAGGASRTARPQTSPAATTQMKRGGDSASTAQAIIPKSFMIVVVNSQDEAHVNQVVKRAIGIADRKRAFIASVMHIGDYRTLSPDLAAHLKRLGIPYIAVSSVPFVPEASQSPTWLFTGEKGVRVVEGFLDIERFIGANGDYQEIQKVDAMELPPDELAGF